MSDEAEKRDVAALVEAVQALVEQSARNETTVRRVLVLMEEDRRKSLWSVIRAVMTERLAPRRYQIPERHPTLRSPPLSAMEAIEQLVDALDRGAARQSDLEDAVLSAVEIISEEREERRKVAEAEGTAIAWVVARARESRALQTVLAILLSALATYLAARFGPPVMPGATKP